MKHMFTLDQIEFSFVTITLISFFFLSTYTVKKCFATKKNNPIFSIEIRILKMVWKKLSQINKSNTI